MAAGDARREGFAYYTPATGTVHVNPCALTRLREADWYVLAIHEVVGHHLHPRDYGRAAGERCALECESAWARHWGVEAEAAEWRAYREARAAGPDGRPHAGMGGSRTGPRRGGMLLARPAAWCGCPWSCGACSSRPGRCGSTWRGRWTGGARAAGASGGAGARKGRAPFFISFFSNE